jgi:hypothetical protein
MAPDERNAGPARRSVGAKLCWSVDRVRRTVGVMSEPEQEPRPRPGPGALFSNWATYDASFTAKLRMAAANTLVKLRNHQGCCGNHGQPGC